MKKTLYLSFLSATIIILSSCGNSETVSKKKFFFETASKNDIDKKTELKFWVDTLDKVLQIELSISKPENIPYPVHNESKDTLRNTSFRIEFLCEGKPVALNNQKLECFKRSLGYCIPSANTNLVYHTDTFSISRNSPIKISVPFYFFSSVPAGNNKQIQMRVYQEEFFSNVRTEKKLNPNAETFRKASQGNNMFDSIEVKYRNKMSQRSIDVQLSFKLNIPKVYSSTFICKKITLQNDKDWTPSGSDVTLFKSSFPDIYFETFFPDPAFLMHTSGIQKSTATWDIGDTSEIVYYTDKDLFGVSVLDYDNFSRDDVIERSTFTVEQLKKSESTPLKFGHVTGFEVRLENTKAKN